MVSLERDFSKLLFLQVDMKSSILVAGQTSWPGTSWPWHPSSVSPWCLSKSEPHLEFSELGRLVNSEFISFPLYFLPLPLLLTPPKQGDQGVSSSRTFLSVGHRTETLVPGCWEPGSSSLLPAFTMRATEAEATQPC